MTSKPNTHQGRVVTFGEVMLRLSTAGFSRLTQASRFDVTYAGAEANVSVALSQLGISARHVTRFPENDLGVAATMALRAQGVDTSHISYGEGRMGLYFLENGAVHRASRIVYDRFGSAFSKISSGDVNWDEIFSGASWFHYTGITPAISQSAADACLAAVTMAAKKGITVSGDINYRRNLWQFGKKASDVMPALMANTHVVVGGVGDFENCCGISGTFDEACRKVQAKFPSVKKITTTHRDSVSASHNRISAVCWNGRELLTSKTYDIQPIVDRIGTGDAFMAGFIYGQLGGRDDQQSLELAAASSAWKHTIEGDFMIATAEELEALVKGENVGKLLR